MAHVRCGRIKRAELSLVQPKPANRQTAKIDPVIGLFAAHQNAPIPVTACGVIGQRDFQRRIHRLGPRIGEKHMIETGRKRCDPRCRFER